MAIKVETNTVYKCQSPSIAVCSVQVIGGSVNVKGSNVTETAEDGKLITPEWSELVSTGDTLNEGIHLLSSLPEWFGFEGNASAIWIKMGVDPRFIK
jgi:hypothetical protein